VWLDAKCRATVDLKAKYDQLVAAGKPDEVAATVLAVLAARSMTGPIVVVDSSQTLQPAAI
jgi:hypothetical protein